MGHRPWSDLKKTMPIYRRVKSWFITKGILFMMKVSEVRARIRNM